MANGDAITTGRRISAQYPLADTALKRSGRSDRQRWSPRCSSERSAEEHADTVVCVVDADARDRAAGDVEAAIARVLMAAAGPDVDR